MSRRSFWPAALTIVVLLGLSTKARGDDDASQSADEQRELAAIERFRTVLEANPRRGVALDRLYGFHVERGTLDELIGQYRKRAVGDAKDGTASMVVGLLEAQRGRDAAAADAFREAEKRLATSALPAYYLGQSLVLIGQPEAAAEAFERAIARKPNRTDLLEIFQGLGRIYQRAQRPEKALSVWTRLEELFPDDPRVEEQIASTLVEEGQAEQALPRIEKLAKQVQDPYRRTTLLIEAAELKVRLKRTADALADLEALIGELSPESWLYREVRKQIEEVFLRNDDLAGLTKYYEKWLAKNPRDLEAITRLARTLSTQGQSAEASKWLERGLEVAPTNKGLRQALIDQLVYERKFAAAAKEYEALDHADPNNPDMLREWGKLLLRDSSRPEADRKQAAVTIWNRLLHNKPKDAVTAAQVADLVRSAGLTDDAIRLYKKAVELAPASAQYREYLGEYLHSLKRSDEALAAWRPMAEGTNHTAKNLARLSEVLAGFGYRKEAIESLTESLKIEKDDLNRILSLADLLHEEGRHDDALGQLDTAGKLASGADEAESVLQAQLKIYQATDTLTSRTEELQKQLDAGAEATAERWHRLARYYEAARQPAEATAAISKALEKDPKSIAILSSAARIHESGGNFLAAADTFRKLAGIDRRFRTEHLTAVAKLEQRLGRREQAIQAGRDLLAAAPGNPEHHKFFADLCFQLGDPEEGLESLRRSVRANPSDPEGMLTLAQALANRQRPGEAIELLWRALDKTDDLDGKLSVIGRLADLYLTSNQFDRLLERLEHQRREADKTREFTLCIAQAYQRAGDISAARQELERLLTEQSRDTALLFQLSQLAESESDLAAATKYQRRVVAVIPNNHDAQLRLAQLLVRNGESDEAAEIWVKLVADEPEPHRNLLAIDQLIANRKFETVLAITSRLLAQKPGDWELIYREAASLAALDRRAEAASRFQAILALKLSDDLEGAALKFEKKKKPTATNAMATAVANAPNTGYTSMSRPGSEFDAPLLRRINEVSLLRAFTGLEPRLNYAYSQQFRGWAPRDYGQARMASLGWLLGFSAAGNSQQAFISSYRPSKAQRANAPRRLWDWYYLQLVRQDWREAFESSRLIAEGNDPEGQYAFLNSLGNRTHSSSRYYRPGQNTDHTPPLPPDQLELMLAAYRKLQLHNPDWLSAAIVNNVQTELRRAKRTDEEETAYRQIVAAANTLQSVQQAMNVAGQRGDVAGVTSLFEKMAKLQGLAKISAGQPSIRMAYPAIGQAMAVRAQDKAFGDVAALLDLYLATIRKQNQAAPKTLAASRSTSRGALGQIPLYSPQPSGRGTRYIYITGDGPLANDYLDQGALILLRNAFELFKQADLVSDLVAHFEKPIESSPPTQRVYLHLAQGAIDWWNDDREEALRQLTLATQQVPDDANLVLDIAELREKNNEFDAALALLDSVSPLDVSIMQRREVAAMRLAERTGNVARARAAAERLFGLRLDAETQVNLASQMHRLGMHEMAETVLSRAQRQSGNKADALVTLMNQYQSQNQTELALQIARQILRRGPSKSGMYSSQYRTSDDSYREQAISVIARSGQLKEMIERAEAQLKSSPKSPQILQTLLDYYHAAGDKPKFKATAQRLVDAKPDDAYLRYQVAQQLRSIGDKAGAVESFLRAIRLDPAVYSNDYWEINQLFREQKKSEELVKVFEEVDLRKGGTNFYAYTEIVQSLLQNEATQQQGLTLLKKVWEAFPDDRNYIMGNFYRDQVFQLPEMFEYAKAGLLPTDDGPAEPWHAVEDLTSYGGDGRIDGIVSRALNVARQQNRIVSLRQDIDGAVRKHPEWRAGKAILAIIDLQTGHPEHVKDVCRELIENKDYPIPAVAGFILAQELDHYGGLEESRLKLLEDAAADYLADTNNSDEFSYTPVRQLVAFYEQADRKEDARRLMQQCLGLGHYDYDPGYSAYRRVENASSIAEELLKVGEPVEAARIYNDVLSDDEALAFAANFGGGNNRQWMESNLRRAIAGLKSDTLTTCLQRLLTPRTAPRDKEGVVDLVLIIEPRNFQKATLVSMFEAALRGTKEVPALRTDVADKLAKLAAAHPNDLSVATAAALAALTGTQPASAPTAVERLVKLADQTPLEAISTGARANSRQRAEAFGQVGLWLVGRECLKQPAFHDAGEKLAARAVAAARRQLDRTYAVAILREWAEIDFERGDKTSAEARFREIVDVLVPRPATKGADEKAARAPVVTTDQFRQTVEFARLAAENGLLSVSRQAVGASLAGGPPAAPVSKNGPSRMIYSPPADNNGDSGTVEQSLADLVQRWRQAGAAPAEIYETLATVVLPSARPDEVFLYPRVIYNSPPGAGGSVGRLLVTAAVRSEKVDDLRERASARAAKALGELSAKVLLAQLAIASGEESRAAELLVELSKRLQRDSLQTTSEMIGDVALSALARKELAAAAVPIIEQAAKNLATSNRFDEAQAMLLRVVRFHLDGHDEPAARKVFHDLAEMMQRLASRNNEYSIRQQSEQFAAEYAKVGWAAESLAELGKYVDITPTNPRFGGGDPITPALVPLARRLLELSPTDRYALLRTWTLPGQGRRSVRLAFAEAPQFSPPADFGRITRPSGSCVSTVGLLVEAAQQCGKLDELTADLEPLAKEKVENADTFRLLLALAQGRAAASEAGITERLSEIASRAKSKPDPLGQVYYDDEGNRGAASVRWSDILVARAAAASDRTAELGERMLKLLFQEASQRNDMQATALIDGALFAIKMRQSGGPVAALATGLEHWRGERLRSVWVSDDGHIGNALARARPVWSPLVFDYPLTGTFEFSIDADFGPWLDGPVSFAGLVYSPLGGRTIAPLGEHETLPGPIHKLFDNDFNRITIQVSPQKVRCLVNGQLFYEDSEPGSACPWLMLIGPVGRKSVFRNAVLTGRPEVLPEVRLSAGNDLRGWTWHVYQGQLPARLTARAKTEGREPGSSRYDESPTAEPTVYDWQAKDGEILGKGSAEQAGNPAPSALCYARPLHWGEKLRYEFFYRPGEFHVHPCLGRLAFLLEPDGVRLHWLTSSGNEEWTGLAPNNAIDVPADRRGPGKLPLKPDDWNALRLAMNGDTLTIELNGQVVYERKLDADEERLFSLFHYQDRSAVRVRNVVLAGNWSKNLPGLEAVNIATKASSAESRARRNLIGESVFAKSAGLVLAKVRAQPAAERYRQLADWVLPSASRSVFQLPGNFVPADDRRGGEAEGRARRSPQGNEFESPALELVKAARESDKLDELADRIAKAELAQGREFDERCRQSLLAAVRIAQARDTDAEPLLRSLAASAAKRSPDVDAAERWPEYLAAVAASERPALQIAALAILDAEISNLETSVKQERPFADRDTWSRMVRNARARIVVSGLPPPGRVYGSEPRLTYWTPVSWAPANDRESTRGVAHWDLRDGTVRHYPGYQEDALYFRIPLTGDFELSCELTSSAWSHARIQYGGVRCDLGDSPKSFDLKYAGRPARKISLTPPLEHLGDWAAYRLKVKDGTCTVFVNDRQILSEPLAVSFDPWLLFDVPHDDTGAVRNFKITGNPSVAERLDLSGGFTLGAWRSDYAENQWQKRGGEIYSPGEKPVLIEGRPAPPRLAPESALHYHRPLLEDGEIEYEFYYKPGKSLVHPCLDQIAFQLAPERIRIHHLTTPADLRSGLSVDNSSDEPANRRGPAKLPLKENAWNRAILAVAGDMMTIQINGVKVYERPIEATNQRTFGLFHYGDETEARVRNVVYRGDWPKQLSKPADWFAVDTAAAQKH